MPEVIVSIQSGISGACSIPITSVVAIPSFSARAEWFPDGMSARE
jgi:hypothetical protein